MGNSTNAKREKRLLLGTAFMAMGTVFSKAVSLIMVVFYSRWLSAGDYGSFELFATYVSLLIPIATLSCGEAVFRLLLEDKGEQRKKQVLSTAILIMLSGLVMAIIILSVFRGELFKQYFFEFLLLYIAETIYSIMTYSARGLHKLKEYAVAGMVNGAVMALSVTILVRVMGMGLSGLIIGTALGYIAGTVFCIGKVKILHYLDLRFVSKDTGKEIIKYSAPLIPNSISWWVANVSDRTLINIFLGSEFNGIYSIANKVPSLCITIFNVFHLSWQESASDIIEAGEDPTDYFNSILQKLIPTLFSVAIGVLSINFILFRYIFDAKYMSGYWHVAILLSATVLSFVAQFFGGVFIGLKNTKVNGFTTLLAAAINVIVDLVLIQAIGLFAASVSTLVAYAFLFVVRFCIIRKRYKLRFGIKGAFYAGLYCYFIISQYLNITWLHIANVFVACVVFCMANKSFITSILAKVKKRVYGR